MTSDQIRQNYLDFFRSKGHLIVASAPLVAKNDPTLMFNNSGMAQFKDYFLGNGTPPSKRIADTQKCLRVSGKHNDLEDVGFDTYHHTMFEMLGNWSFGDYFKQEALTWSWELLTEVFKLPKERIYVSVFEGDAKDGVPFDQEAWDIWKNMVGEERIILGNKKDNFWEMGEVGPCGPCSEIHIDLRNQDEVDAVSGKTLVNADHPQVVEIWNNVFMQFERKADGSLIPLPSKHVDTGMGFERLCMAIQGKQSNYDTDVFQGTIKFVADLAGKTYNTGEKWTDISLRVIADHIRAIAFTIADGQLPSNNKAGYVIRRILRRAVRYGYTYLGFREPFLHQLVPLLANQFAHVFPELKAQEEFVKNVIREEENSFLRTLELGIKRLDNLLVNEKGGVLNGETVFELYDTFGFPSDLTALIAKEKGYEIDEAGYLVALDEQKARSRKDANKEATDWVEIRESAATEFLGYDYSELPVQIIKYRKVKTKVGGEYHFVFDQTPFYAEMGGQVGDSGTFWVGEISIEINDCKKENDLFIHISNDKNIENLIENKVFEGIAKINIERRNLITSNHTATHLMLSAMRKVLGNHISQKGSFQNEEVTRFDFSHFSKVSDQEIAEIENMVNEKIRLNISLDEKRNVPIADAIALGATATFGEKYGDFVRVITFDPAFSLELCGGTHVAATGQIGLFKFVSEGSVSAGVRRVEAITGIKALSLFDEQLNIVSEIKELFKGQNDIVKAVKNLQEEKNALQKKIESFEREKLLTLKDSLISKIEFVGDLRLIASKVEVNKADDLKTLCFELRNTAHQLVVALVANIDGKPALAVMVDESLVTSKNLNAGTLVREMAKEVKGGGGGQATFASAGGSDVNGLDKALEKIRTLLG